MIYYPKRNYIRAFGWSVVASGWVCFWLGLLWLGVFSGLVLTWGMK